MVLILELAWKQAIAIRKNEAAAIRDERKDAVTQMTQLRKAVQVPGHNHLRE